MPSGGLFLTAGADVQKDRIEVEIVAWGRGKESWSVDYRVFEGDTSRPQVWERLTGLLNETFVTASELELPILQLAIDSGFATTEVYQWAPTGWPRPRDQRRLARTGVARRGRASGCGAARRKDQTRHPRLAGQLRHGEGRAVSLVAPGPPH